MFAKRYSTDWLTPARLDTDYYNPDAIAVIQKVKSQGVYETFGSSGEVWGFGAYELCNQIEESSNKDAPGFIKIGDIKPPFVDVDSVLGVTDKTHAVLSGAHVKSGDLLVSIAGTIGAAAIVPETTRKLSGNQALVKYRANKEKLDEYFVAAYTLSEAFRLITAREAGGAVQKNLYLYNFLTIPIPKPNNFVQKYIGDKVRQAEQLRAWVKTMGTEVESLVSNEAMNSACATPEKKHTQPQLDDLTHRLDPKYYGNRAVAVFRQAKAIGMPLACLVTGIANGFEERVFFDTGRDYITVSEVSSGRLELSSAPKISQATQVPDKAIIHERCALVVRTGSIGTSVKVDTRDRGAVISSHLIRLEFADEADAAAVAAFLCSTAGRVLQHKISYGAVQPQIGQDELLALPIPQFVLDSKEQILALITEQESAIRASKALTTMAKFLVEALIEGHLSEAELIAAEQALQSGNDQLDRHILNRLKTDGFDGQGQALFSDLDQLYSLLEQADHS